MRTNLRPGLLSLLLLFCFACKGGGGMGGPNGPNGQPDKQAEREMTPLVITLSEGQNQDQSKDGTKSVAGTPLSPKRTAELLAKFGEPLAKEKNKPKFLKRPSSQPAPISAIPKEIPFPPKSGGPDAPEVKSPDLQILSVAPEGDLERAPRLSISFSNPMIAVSDPSSDEGGDPLGIKISPRPEGKWRWLGTQTLIFEPKGAEFPRATEYTVTIPKDVTDVSKLSLNEEVTQSFKLPRPKVENISPDITVKGLEPVFYLTFDQPVDAEVLKKITHLKESSKEIGLTVLSKDAAEKAQPGISSAFENHLDGRVFYFRSKQKLKPNTYYTVQVDAGLKSTEGPLLSESAWTSGFSTYAPLALSSRYPQKGEKTSPFNGFSINFNNQLDAEVFKQSLISSIPKIENMKVRMSGSSIYITGKKNGNTKYKITVNKQLKDSFGQSLGKSLDVVFETGRAPKSLSHGFEVFTVLDPSSPPSLPIYTTNVPKLDILAYKVSPTDWPNYLKFKSKYQRAYTPEDRRKLTPPGVEVARKTISIKGEDDHLIASQLDLAEYLDDREGNLIFWVRDPEEDSERYRSREFLTWVQGTKIGIDLEVDSQKGVALITNLATGKAIKNAKVQLGASRSTSNDEGLASFDLESSMVPILLVETESSVGFLPQMVHPYGYSGGWRKSSLSQEGRWFIFDDRGLYKPGEKVNIKGYVRAWQRGPEGQLTNYQGGGQEINWTLNDPRGNKIKEGKAKVDGFASIDIEFTLPKNTNLGNHQLRINGGSLPGGYHSVNVQEFRRPEFEVSASVDSTGPHLLFGDATVKATASYYAGGGLAGSKVQWSVNASPSGYTPPGRSEYTFGRWTPWWSMGPWWDNSSYNTNSAYQSFEGQADGDGSHLLNLKFEKMYPPKPTSVSVTASVADVNRQQMSGNTSVLVHPSERYVGLKTEKSFVDEDSDFELQAIVTDIDGKILVGIPVTVELLKTDWEYDKRGNYKQTLSLVESKSLTSSEVSTKVTLKAKEGGTYKIRATVEDEKARPNQTEYTLWKAGGLLPSKDKVELESLTVVPDRKEYKPGDKARMLVMAPFPEGEGMVVWSRDGIADAERFTLKNGTATIERKLTEEQIPNLHASFTAVGKAKFGKGYRPAVAGGNLNLSISKASKTLAIELLPSKEKLEPGAEVEVDVLVKNHLDEPVDGAEVTLWIVDEAVLGLVGYQTPNPLASFLTNRGSGVSPYHMRTHVALGDPELQEVPESEEEAGEGAYFANYDSLAGSASGRGSMRQELAAAPAPSARAPGRPQGKARARKKMSKNKDKEALLEDSMRFDVDGDLATSNTSADEPKQFAVRKNFNAVATYRGKLATDADGKTKVKVKLPDNLTRYRIMSVAVKDTDLFGKGDQVLTSRLPVMVRPSLPRFLNFGDKAKLPVVIQNQTDEEISVDIVGEATGITWLGASGQNIKVAPNDRVEVQFEAEATSVGEASFRFGAVSGKFSDAATIKLPVYTPASGEAFATYGSVGKDGAIKQPIRRPGDVWSQFGGLQISLSSTALSELTDAFLYLYEYPYECAEQKSSRILGVASMREVLSAFNPDMMPTGAEIKAQMAKDLLHLSRLQNSDGGFEYWRRDEDSEPFVSVHVAHALARAKIEGYEVNENTLERALDYLRNIESKCRAKSYSVWTTRSLQAYSLYVRNLVDNQDVAEAKKLFKVFAAEKNPNIEAIGWLWPTLTKHAKGSAELKALKTLVKNKATQTADKAQFTMSYGEGDGEYLLLHSSRRTDAILLAGLLGDEPKNQLNTKLVRGLLAHRTRGRWTNTQENIWILLALQSYFREYEKETPNFLAQIWLKADYMGEEKFKGRSGKEAQLKIPMDKVPETDTDLILGKKGPGRLYYRIGMKYAPKSLRLPAENRGFIVERSYKGIDDAADVSQTENGDWKIKAGAKVEVTLTMVAPERRYHVALVDQLPAGLEPLNPALKGTPPTKSGGNVSRGRGKGRYGRHYGWWGRWYVHDNLRDERVEAFASLVYPGVYTYTYTALATTPGEYVLPPLKAEEMYSPEVYGRTATGRLVVE